MSDDEVKTPKEKLSLPTTVAYKKMSKVAQAKLIQDAIEVLLDHWGYRKSDLTFAFDVEPLTVERWIKGSGMREESFAKFAEGCKAILEGQSLRPIKTSDTGFVTWRYQIEHVQATAQRTWYIASSSLVPVNSLAFAESIKNLLSQKRQKEEEFRCEAPVKIYIYPPGSEAARSLVDWEATLNEINALEETLCGSIIGIADDSLPWFLPDVRALIIEKTTDNDALYVTGYIRVSLDPDSQRTLLMALDPHERSPDTPWLKVSAATAERWYRDCKKKYSTLVDTICQKQAEQKKEFQVHYFTADDLK